MHLKSVSNTFVTWKSKNIGLEPDSRPDFGRRMPKSEILSKNAIFQQNMPLRPISFIIGPEIMILSISESQKSKKIHLDPPKVIFQPLMMILKS